MAPRVVATGRPARCPETQDPAPSRPKPAQVGRGSTWGGRSGPAEEPHGATLPFPWTQSLQGSPGSQTESCPPLRSPWSSLGIRLPQNKPPATAPGWAWEGLFLQLSPQKTERTRKIPHLSASSCCSHRGCRAHAPHMPTNLQPGQQESTHSPQPPRPPVRPCPPSDPGRAGQGRADSGVGPSPLLEDHPALPPW